MYKSVNRFSVRAVALAIVSVFLVACGSSGETPTNDPSSSSSSVTSSSNSSMSASSSQMSQAADVALTIDTQQRFQTIDGFGAALPMWTSNRLTTSEVHTLVGVGEDGIGLSILRTIINPDPNLWSRAVNSLAEAKSHGENLKIIASPWSPPAHMKSNGSTTDGGKLLLDYYDDYALHLNSYVEFMTEQGVNIDVVSVQNEPDWHPSYESCDWTGEELRNFVRDFGDLVQADLLVGESLRFDRDYSDPALNDDEALKNFEYVGGHLYSAESSGTFTAYPLAEEKGKRRWMTEWLIHEADGEGAAIWGGADPAVWDETLDEVLASVHKSMEVNWNAYIWWWARRFYSLIGDGESAFGTERGEILKRGWAFSHYANYVRPGYTRVGADSEQSEVYITAFQGDNRLVAVILNRSEQDLTNVELVTAEGIKTASAVVTSLEDNRAPLEVMTEDEQAQLPLLPARSVVTVLLNY